jgi:hypothetical protein
MFMMKSGLSVEIKVFHFNKKMSDFKKIAHFSLTFNPF